MTHEIVLNRYTAQPSGLRSFLKLGTSGSYGVEQLALHPRAEWEGLAVTVTFHPPGGGEPVRMLADGEGGLAVPPEATAAAGEGQIVFAGLAEGVQRISCDLAYRVEEHAGVEGAESTATPTVLEQAVTAAAQSALEAQSSASDAADNAAAAAQSAQDAAEQANTARQETAASQTNAESAAESAQSAAGSAQGAVQQANRAEQWAQAAAQSAQKADASAEESVGIAVELATAVSAAAQLADAAASSATVAEASADTAFQNAEAAVSSAKNVFQAMEAVTQSASQASASQTAAAQSAAEAAESCADAEAAAGRAEAAAVHPPKLSAENRWLVWDQQTEVYQDTGVSGVGPKGDQGDQGPQGIQGQRGPQGEKGDQGNGVELLGSYGSYEDLVAAHPSAQPGTACVVAGELWVFTDGVWVNAGVLQGVKGDTPVKGVDYWTEADLAQMVQQTMEALPVYAGEMEEVMENE